MPILNRCSPVGASNGITIAPTVPLQEEPILNLGEFHRSRGGDWFAGKSSTRIATFFIRLRNSCGSESNASSTTLTKCSRFILHPLNKGTLSPSSHRRFRRHRHFLSRGRLPLHLLPRLVL